MQAGAVMLFDTTLFRGTGSRAKGKRSMAWSNLSQYNGYLDNLEIAPGLLSTLG